MRILVAGATGMVGRALLPELSKKYSVSVLGRSTSNLNHQFPGYEAWSWDDIKALKQEKFDCVINLCGENIGQSRWSESRKYAICQSRTDTTKRVVDICNSHPGTRLLNASAIGIYGMKKTPKEQLSYMYDESDLPPSLPHDFLSEVGIAWEKAAKGIDEKCLVLMRFGVILNQHDGALAKMLTPFKLGLGGKIGSGSQPFSWVSLSDVVSAILFLVENPTVFGPVNIVSPHVVTQYDFAKQLASALHRPAIFPLPTFIVKLQFGEMGETLLCNGLSVKSRVLPEAGFKFTHARLASFLEDEFEEKK